MKKKKKKISRRIIMYCIFFGIVLSSSIAGLGINAYQRRVFQHYDEYILMLLKYVQKQLDAKEMEKWVKTKNEESKTYKQARSMINNIKEASQYKMNNNSDSDKKFQVSYLYIVSTENIMKNEISYIMSAFIESDRVADKERKPDHLGDIVKGGEGKYDLPNELIDAYKMMSKKKLQEVQYVNNKNEYYKSMRTGILPVINEKGESIAYICVDVAINGINEDIGIFVSVISFGTIIIMMCFVLFFIHRMNKTVIKPITVLCENTFDFMCQTQEKVEAKNMSFRELNIKTGDEIEELSEHLNNMTKELIVYMTNMEEITAERERINTEYDVARLIQTQTIPSEFPAFPERTDFDIYALLNPAKEIGGDFYDFFFTDETHLCMIIASITGSGIKAALYLVIVKILIKNYAQMGLSPEKILFEVNNHLCESNKSNMYATAFVGVLDLHSGQFCYANAYNEVPFFRGVGNRFEPLIAKRGFVLSGLEEVEYCMHEIQLRQGDMLFFYTEDLIKILQKNENEYNKDSLQMELNQLIETEFELKKILSYFDEKAKNKKEVPNQSADITMMVFRYFGNY